MNRRLPEWIRVRIGGDKHSAGVQAMLSKADLNTVCVGAHCPNIHECYGRGTATFMILGNYCTRQCRFCAVDHGIPESPDSSEPERVAQAALELGLAHVVITSVTRDDMPDGGAAIFAETIRAVRKKLVHSTIEVLTPDFQGQEDAVRCVLDAGPDIYNHNLETVRRLQSIVRPQAEYCRSLDVLRIVAAQGGATLVKSGLMVGLGETVVELQDAMKDLYDAGCRILTIGQYLAPSSLHHPVRQYVPPKQFAIYAEFARQLGFDSVASGPLVRSSYNAEALYREMKSKKTSVGTK